MKFLKKKQFSVTFLTKTVKNRLWACRLLSIFPTRFQTWKEIIHSTHSFFYVYLLIHDFHNVTPWRTIFTDLSDFENFLWQNCTKFAVNCKKQYGFLKIYGKSVFIRKNYVFWKKINESLKIWKEAANLMQHAGKMALFFKMLFETKIWGFWKNSETFRNWEKLANLI